MSRKDRFTEKQRHILEKIKVTGLAKGREDDGSSVYFFMDGSKAGARTVNSLIERGVLHFEQGPLGDGQMLVLT